MDILVSSNFERLMWFLAKGRYFISPSLSSPSLIRHRVCVNTWLERSTLQEASWARRLGLVSVTENDRRLRTCAPGLIGKWSSQF